MECYLTAIQAAAYLGISEKTVRRMIAAGQIVNVDAIDPRRLAIPLSGLKAFKRQTAAGNEPAFVAVYYADIAAFLGEPIVEENAIISLKDEFFDNEIFHALYRS